MGKSLAERLWSKVEKTEGCWFWRGSLVGNGYGQIRVEGRLRYVHRVSLDLVGRSVPDGLVVDHLCRVRHCVNPDHLEVVTHRENVIRGVGPTAQNAKRDACAQGHPLEVLWPGKSTRRDCRICLRIRGAKAQRAYQARKVAA